MKVERLMVKENAYSLKNLSLSQFGGVLLICLPRNY
jgi:hypothetical protein